MSDKNEYFLMGRQITGGVFTELGWLIGWILLISIIFQYFKPLDNCDKDWWNRCGVKVITDTKTGKEYLMSAEGYIIERGK